VGCTGVWRRIGEGDGEAVAAVGGEGDSDVGGVDGGGRCSGDVPGEGGASAQGLGGVVGGDAEGGAGVDDVEFGIGPVDGAVVAGVAGEGTEVEGAGFGGELFFGCLLAGEEVFEAGEGAGGIHGRWQGAEEWALAIVGGGEYAGWAEVELFPVVVDGVAIGIGGGGGESKWGARGYGVGGAGVDGGGVVFARGGLGELGARAVHEFEDLPDVAGVEVGVVAGLEVVAGAGEAGVAHDRGAGAGFVGGVAVAAFGAEAGG
jgi:hypothetical protein